MGSCCASGVFVIYFNGLSPIEDRTWQERILLMLAFYQNELLFSVVQRVEMMARFTIPSARVSMRRHLGNRLFCSSQTHFPLSTIAISSRCQTIDSTNPHSRLTCINRRVKRACSAAKRANGCRCPRVVKKVVNETPLSIQCAVRACTQ